MKVSLSVRTRQCPYFGQWLFEATVVKHYVDYWQEQPVSSQAQYASSGEAKDAARAWFESRYVPATS